MMTRIFVRTLGRQSWETVEEGHMRNCFVTVLLTSLLLSGCGEEGTADEILFAPQFDSSGGNRGRRGEDAAGMGQGDQASVEDGSGSAADAASETVCVANCAGKQCGADGCGGQCGTCPPEAPDCVNFVCGSICTPDCLGKECGDDGCGGKCGVCPLAAPQCVDDLCQVVCYPDCVGKECGEDGCGAWCGDCPLEAPDCIDFQCGVVCYADCVGKECGDDGCGGECGVCPLAAPACVDFFCQVVCAPDCGGKECGDDGCGGWCGICPDELPVCDAGLCHPDSILDGCTEEGKQIFLATESKYLLRFEPATMNLVNVGWLNCNANFGETPYSMSVDRNGNAWVLYSDGTLWKVSTEDASCQATPFTPNQQGLELFGMGFSTDSPDTMEETLFIAGGDYFDLLYGDATLGSIDMDSFAVTSISPFPQGSKLPELTGTRDAELWGFFPSTSPPKVARIDKTNATQSLDIALPSQFFSNVQAWAFAHWGGDYYIFFKSQFEAVSSIWRVDGNTGDLTQVVANTGHVITGAGVSTCAPTTSD